MKTVSAFYLFILFHFIFIFVLLTILIILGADLEIIVEETPLFAHKTILKYRCPSFFEKHLSSSPSKVVLEDETFRAFYVFLEFLYTGNVLSFHSNAPQVLSLFFFFFIFYFFIFYFLFFFYLYLCI